MPYQMTGPATGCLGYRMVRVRVKFHFSHFFTPKISKVLLELKRFPAIFLSHFSSFLRPKAFSGDPHRFLGLCFKIFKSSSSSYFFLNISEFKPSTLEYQWWIKVSKSLPWWKLLRYQKLQRKVPPFPSTIDTCH